MGVGVLHATKPVDFVHLTKPRIVVFVMWTAATGFLLAAPTAADALIGFHLLLGTVLVAAGTNALNQVVERDIDARMRRTRNRPLPAGRMDPSVASAYAWTLGVVGVAYLGVMVNLITALLAALTLTSYVFLYTPLKRRTSLATLIGGVPGALPIVGGWTAVAGGVGMEAVVLFWILFLWQLPHFLALGWVYRDDYHRGRLVTLSTTDQDGHLTFGHATAYSAALLPISILPAMLGTLDAIYVVGAVTLGVMLLRASLRAFRAPTVAHARSLFRASLVYLPVLMLTMIADRII